MREKHANGTTPMASGESNGKLLKPQSKWLLTLWPNPN